MSQVLAVLCAAAVVGALWRRPSLTGGVLTVAIAAVATMLFWSNAWPTASGYDTTRKQAPKLDRYSASVAGGQAMSLNVAFLTWAADRMARDATFSFVPSQPESIYQWSTYQIFPRRYTDPERADFLLFYGAEPKDVQYDRSRFPRTTRFGRGFHIARSADAN